MVADSAAKNTASNVLPVGTLARRWLAVCIIGWALLIPVDAWLADQKALRWRYVDAATKTVLGAAAAVALGGLILNHIQSRLDTERQDAQRQEWLNRHFAFAVLTHDAMRRTLGQLAAVAYSAVSATGALSAKVPLATLRADIARRPHVPAHLNNLNELIAALSELAHDTVSNTLTSPLAIVRLQLDRVTSVLSYRLMKATAQPTRRMGLSDVGEPPQPTDTGGTPVPAEQQMLLTDDVMRTLAEVVTPEIASDIVHLAERLLVLGGQVVGTAEFDPSTVGDATIRLLLQAQRVEGHASLPDWYGGLSVFGESDEDREDNKGAGQLPSEKARKPVLEVERLFAEIDSMRDVLFTSTQSLLRAAYQVGDSDRISAILCSLPEEELFRKDTAWDLWRRRHGFILAAEEPSSTKEAGT